MIFLAADDLDAQGPSALLAVRETEAVVAEVVVVAHQQHLRVQSFLEDGLHEVAGGHPCQFLREVHEHHPVRAGLLKEFLLLVRQSEHLGLEVFPEHLQGMIGEGEHHGIKSSFAGLIHHLLHHELMSPMHAIEGADCRHTWSYRIVLTHHLHSYLQRRQSSHLSSSPRKRFSTFT